MAAYTTHVAGNLVRRVNEFVIGGSSGGLRKDGPVFVKKSGPWKVEVEANRSRAYLIHYGTKMLEWRYDLTKFPAGIHITGTWTGWGSVSDQTGVNAALWALGSKMRYSRDIRGGGARQSLSLLITKVKLCQSPSHSS